MALLTPPATVRELDPKTLETLAIRTLTGPPVSLVNAADDTHVYLATDDNLLVFTPAGACA